MVEQPSKLTSFIAELRRRHVFRVAAGYAVFAFVVLQLGEIVLPTFSAEWALQFVVVFAVLGFPVVMVLAWVFDVTTEGIQVTDALEQDDDDLVQAPSTGVLPRLALMAVTLLTVGGVGSWWVLNTLQGTDTLSTGLGLPVFPTEYDPDEAIRSLAVLPLQNFSENAEQDYFVAGMHEALIARLSQIEEIRVVSRTTVARYATSHATAPATDPKTIPEIARELGVKAVIEGSVCRVGDEVRITVQLIHGASDTHIWAQEYLRSFSDVLALQSEVANAIAEAIQAELSIGGDTPMLAYASGSEVPAANEAFMRARFEEMDQTPEGLLAALDHYRQAVEADPTFAAAYARLAGTELMLGMSEASDLTESIARARVLALKAVEMDPELPEALDILALIEEQLDEGMVGLRPGLDAPEPITEVRLVSNLPETGDSVGDGAAGEDSIIVISVDPEIVSSAGDFRRDSMSSVESLTQVGRQLRAASADWANRTGRMASMDPARMVTSAQQFAAAGRTEEAINVLTAISERSPEHVEAWDALESLHASTGQYEELLAMRREWVENAGGDAESVDQLEERLRTDGAAGYWEWRLEVLQERESEGEDVSPVYMATAQAALGNTEEALASLREAAGIHDRRLLTSLRTDPVWDSMRSDPRFASLMRQIRNEVSGRGAGRGGRGGRGGGGGGGGAGGRGPN